MRRLAAVTVALLVLVAATPDSTIEDLETQGYFIEPGAGVTPSVVSDAVFEGRAAGGRLYIVVLANEPPGGAPTFSDGVLDELRQGYVVTIAPESVGWASDQSFWTDEEMDSATDQSVTGSTDDQVLRIFMSTLTGQDIVTPGEPGQGDGSSSGSSPLVWLLVIGGGVLFFWFLSRRNRGAGAAGELERVKVAARQKIDEIANDVIEMEPEVSTSVDPEVKGHYSRAAAMYSKALDATERARTAQQMLAVVEELDLAIWELDCAEALLDGKPKPRRPEPPPVAAPSPPPPAGAAPASPGGQPNPGMGVPPAPGTVVPDGYDRRPDRRSTDTGDMLSMVLGMLMSQGMGGGGMFGGGFAGGRRGPSGGSMRGGGGASRGGGFRSGGGRSRGGARRRG